MTAQEYWLRRELRFTQDKMNNLDDDNPYHDVLRREYTNRLHEIRAKLDRMKVA